MLKRISAFGAALCLFIVLLGVLPQQSKPAKPPSGGLVSQNDFPYTDEELIEE